MVISDLSYMLYFLSALISILGIAYFGVFITQKRGLEKAYRFPELKNKKWIILKIYIIFYLLAGSIEFLGHFIGIWTWISIFFIPLHAAVWWAPCLTVMLFTLASLDKYLRYIIFLGFILLFEILQEAFIHLVSHNSYIFGTPYITIIIVMSTVSLTSFFALNLIKKLKLLK